MDNSNLDWEAYLHKRQENHTSMYWSTKPQSWDLSAASKNGAMHYCKAQEGK